MKKVRSDAAWNKLSEEQRQTLDQWLFDKKLSYTKAWNLAKAKFGYSGSESSVKRYFLRRRDEKDLESCTDFQLEMATVINAPGDADESRAAVMKVLGQFLFRQVRESPEDVQKWGRIAQLLLQNDYNEVLRRTKAEEHRIRREAMAFARQKFEFDTVERALRALPQLRELAEAQKDPQTKQTERNERIEMIRQMMFGDGDEDKEEEKLQAPSSQDPEKHQTSNNE